MFNKELKMKILESLMESLDEGIVNKLKNRKNGKPSESSMEVVKIEVEKEPKEDMEDGDGMPMKRSPSIWDEEECCDEEMSDELLKKKLMKDM